MTIGDLGSLLVAVVVRSVRHGWASLAAMPAEQVLVLGFVVVLPLLFRSARILVLALLALMLLAWLVVGRFDAHSSLAAAVRPDTGQVLTPHPGW